MTRLLFPALFGLLFSASVAANALPEFTYQQYPITENSGDAVHELVAEAAPLVYPEPNDARTLLIKALKKVSQGDEINEYDYLWTQYGLLKSSFATGGADFDGGTREDYMHVAQNVLVYLDSQGDTGEWSFTEEGAFRMEVYREAGNGLAWFQMEDATNDAELNKALTIINNTLAHSRGSEDYYLYDTQVRILLMLKKDAEAYEVVTHVLDDDPSFGDFQDFHDNEQYQSWLESQ